MDAVIRPDEVTRRYDCDAAPAVHGVSLRSAPGEAVAAGGPPGSGTPAPLNLIAGLARAASGTVTVAGQRTGRLSQTGLTRFRRQPARMIFRFFNLDGRVAGGMTGMTRTG